MRASVAGFIAASGAALFAGSTSAESRYYLDFMPETTGPVYPYTPAEKEIILDDLRTIYAAFPHMTFSLAEPPEPYSPVRFNSTAIGTSTGIDFRDVADIDVASINALMAFAFLGVSPTPPMVIKASINLAAHEIGHLEGLRHHDAFTPIAAGVPGTAVAAGFVPPYPGPTMAFLTHTEVQSLTLSLPGGFTLSQLTADLVVGQRSAIKLAFNAAPPAPNFWLESSLPGGPAGDDIESAAALPLTTIGIPNVTLPGDPLHGLALFADVIAVKGATTSPFDSDYYTFFARAGDIVQIEVLSEIISSRLDEYNVAVAVYDPDELDDPDFPGIYYLTDTNGDERESSDALILDLHITASKDYIIKIFPQFPGHPPDDVGEYELYVAAFRFEAPPECNEPFADVDADGDVDFDDFGAFQRCITGVVMPALPEACRCFDIDRNRAIDADDLMMFMDCRTGPGIPHATHPNPLCVEQPPP